MADRFSKETRSWIMSRIRKANTRPEMAVRRAVHRMGIRYRLHRRDLPGTPDIAMIGRRKAIFVHGCFWHQHQGCRLVNIPRSNTAYWSVKLKANTVRDEQSLRSLNDRGWDVLVIWECEVAHPDVVSKRLRKFLNGRARQSGPRKGLAGRKTIGADGDGRP